MAYPQGKEAVRSIAAHHRGSLSRTRASLPPVSRGDCHTSPHAVCVPHTRQLTLESCTPQSALARAKCMKASAAVPALSWEGNELLNGRLQ
eukprot:scaffold143876_cov32-Tisochrysis_lutea.AAC.3